MCGIAGVVSSSDSDEIGNILKRMLQVIQHRGPDGAGCVIDGELQRKMRFQDLDLENKKGRIALGHVRLAITGEITGLQPFQSDGGQLTLLHNGEIYNYRELRSKLSKTCLFTSDTDSEVILRLIEREYKGELFPAVQKTLPQLDGVYALVVSDNKETVIARDKIGVRQLYFYANGKHTAFASEKKPLMAVSHQGTEYQRLLPGQVAVLNGSTIRVSSFWRPGLIRSNDHIDKKPEAMKSYDTAIRESIQKRVTGRDRVGIIFSGGIDSFLIAYMVQKMGVPFTCYTAGCNGANDIEWAKQLSRDFCFPLRVKTLTLKDIEDLIPQVIRDIEDYSLNQVEVAIPIYASVRMAQETGERVILTGQGADELFGGYPWYSTIVDREGYESFERYSWDDAFLLYKECLEREDKIAMAHSIELRVPFLDPEVIRAAFHISPSLKINRGRDELGKRIHREYCESLGIPENIAFRKKEAAQHGANVHSAFEQLATETNITDGMLKKAGYDPNVTVTEKLGSSSRYGFRYGDAHLWKPQLNVQYYLDSIAEQLKLLIPKIRKHWVATTEKLDVESLA